MEQVRRALRLQRRRFMIGAFWLAVVSVFLTIGWVRQQQQIDRMEQIGRVQQEQIDQNKRIALAQCRQSQRIGPPFVRWMRDDPDAHFEPKRLDEFERRIPKHCGAQ